MNLRTSGISTILLIKTEGMFRCSFWGCCWLSFHFGVFCRHRNTRSLKQIKPQYRFQSPFHPRQHTRWMERMVIETSSIKHTWAQCYETRSLLLLSGKLLQFAATPLCCRYIIFEQSICFSRKGYVYVKSDIKEMISYNTNCRRLKCTLSCVFSLYTNWNAIVNEALSHMLGLCTVYF